MIKQKDYFKTFVTISKALGSTLNLEEILHLIVESAVESMEGKAACLFLADREKDVFVEKAQIGLSKSYLHANPVRAQQMKGDLLKDGYLSIYDVNKDPRAENQASKKKEGIESILVVPVRINQETIGVLTLYTATHRKFSQDDVDFLSALAEQGGMAINRSTLIDRIQENTRIFRELSANINASLNIKEILHNLTVALSKALNMKGVSIRLLNKETGEMPIVAGHGLSDQFLYRDQGFILKNLGHTLKGETIVIEDVDSDTRIRYKAELKKEGICSALFVPIKTREDVVGMMRLLSSEPQRFPKETIDLVNALAEQGGLAIQNASMVLMLQEEKKELEQDMWIHKSWL
ncbi:MAG: GAF domain-containing protein [SAR324 cluster bacterium]|nr:GAF domain-containing protein [SAR324 cluster bacterium]